ncbi:hypothetical protein [Phocaeicola coprocola]|jgi:hypothetical protein|uniref:hypothetical protein n=1 Tax=Phocaeicola coprocola TaxID=310298 RepID=UPI002942A3FE|nr:hypothetical protein [Phocaeicola coprocola]
MAAKKETVNLTYDALWFKIFMDSYDIKFYGREIFISSGLSGRRDLFMQMLGNVGGYARMNDFNKDIDVVIVSNYLMDKFKSGEKDEFFQILEDAINASNTPYRKLKFTTENLLLDYLKDRANGRIRQNQKDLKENDNTVALNERIEDSIKKDQVMLDLIKKYKESTKEPQQQNLF